MLYLFLNNVGVFYLKRLCACRILKGYVLFEGIPASCKSTVALDPFSRMKDKIISKGSLGSVLGNSFLLKGPHGFGVRQT